MFSFYLPFFPCVLATKHVMKGAEGRGIRFAQYGIERLLYTTTTTDWMMFVSKQANCVWSLYNVLFMFSLTLKFWWRAL